MLRVYLLIIFCMSPSFIAAASEAEKTIFKLTDDDMSIIATGLRKLPPPYGWLIPLPSDVNLLMFRGDLLVASLYASKRTTWYKFRNNADVDSLCKDYRLAVLRNPNERTEITWYFLKDPWRYKLLKEAREDAQVEKSIQESINMVLN